MKRYLSFLYFYCKYCGGEGGNTVSWNKIPAVMLQNASCMHHVKEPVYNQQYVKS